MLRYKYFEEAKDYKAFLENEAIRCINLQEIK